MIDLTAICQKHGITLEEHEWGWTAYSVTYTAGNIDRIEGHDHSPEDAVRNLLMQRYNIRLRPNEHPNETHDWTAHILNPEGYLVAETRATMTAAVIALADRLLTGGQE